MPICQFTTRSFRPPAANVPAHRLFACPPMPTRSLAAVRLPASGQCTCSPPARLAIVANVPLPPCPLATRSFRSPAAKVPHANVPARNPSVPPPAANVPPFVCPPRLPMCRLACPLPFARSCRRPFAARLPFDDADCFATASSNARSLEHLTPGRPFCFPRYCLISSQLAFRSLVFDCLAMYSSMMLIASLLDRSVEYFAA
jgi:hypothetical protein